MRNLLALSALLCLASSRPTPACGFYMPRVFLITDHVVPGGAPRERAFARTDHRDVPGDDGTWELLAPSSYDATQIADAPAGRELALTLLGRDGKLAVTATHRVFLRWSFAAPGAMGAYELDTHGKHFDIAVAGAHVDLVFEHLASGFWTSADARWLADNHLAWDSAMVEHIGNVETLTAYVDGSYQTAIRREGQLVGTYPGTPLGRLGTDGMEYLLLDHGGDVQSIML